MIPCRVCLNRSYCRPTSPANTPCSAYVGPSLPPFDNIDDTPTYWSDETWSQDANCDVCGKTIIDTSYYDDMTRMFACNDCLETFGEAQIRDFFYKKLTGLR